MLAFHNDIEVKRKYVARTEAHRKADQIIRGTGWNGSKGCAVGCTLENYNHAQYPVELGIPEWLARVEDTLFEGMSADRATFWPSEFLLAIPLGVTEHQFLYNVKAPFIVLVLESSLKNFDHNKYPACAAVVRGSIALWKRDDLEGVGREGAPWAAARTAAFAAAESATWSAAESAAESAAGAAAWAGAWAAASAAEAGVRSVAESAAWSAAHLAARAGVRSAAESAAKTANYDYFAGELLHLLSNLENSCGD